MRREAAIISELRRMVSSINVCSSRDQIHFIAVDSQKDSSSVNNKLKSDRYSSQPIAAFLHLLFSVFSPL